LLLFDNHAWHYKLILYTFGEQFFLDTSEVDWKATEDESLNKEVFQIVYKSKPKTVNLCPYCRAVVASVITLPIVFLWRLYPHKPKKELTHQEVMKKMRRRSKYIRIAAGSFNISFGIWHILTDQDYTAAAIQIFIGATLILIFPFWSHVSRVIVPIIQLIRKVRYALFPKTYKIKKTKPKKVKSPSLFMTKIHAEHEKICPAIYFIDKSTEENLT